MTKINYIKSNKSAEMLFLFEHFELSALYFNKVKTITIGCESFAEKVKNPKAFKNFIYIKRIAVLENKFQIKIKKDEWLKLLRTKL